MHIPPLIDSLRQRIETLEKRFEESQSAWLRSSKALGETLEMAIEHLRHHDAEVADALERIVKLEVHAFPNLLKDIKQLRNVIGDEAPQTIINSLDRRKLTDY